MLVVVGFFCFFSVGRRFCLIFEEKLEMFWWSCVFVFQGSLCPRRCFDGLFAVMQADHKSVINLAVLIRGG